MALKVGWIDSLSCAYYYCLQCIEYAGGLNRYVQLAPAKPARFIVEAYNVTVQSAFLFFKLLQ